MKPAESEAIFQAFYNTKPLPSTELTYKNHYTLLVAVVLSAQATDISVNKATKELFATYDTPQKMLQLTIEELIHHIKSIGLYRAKARNVLALSKMLIEQYNSTVPSDFNELVKLPGVGRKTANVILNCAFGQDTVAVDTHVYRVAKRIGYSTANKPALVEQDLLAFIPKKWLYGAHHWLILHGRYICKSRKPLCNECNITKYCKFFKGQQVS